MNIQQFQYILAVSEFKHFELAAEKCCISQSTLSTMISKFEDEIGIKVFDRKKKPVEVTLEGSILIEQLKIISKDIEQLHEITKEIKGEIAGNLNLSVIPTIAPFLLPKFLQTFASQFPDLNIVVREETTEEIAKKLKSREIDIGIVSISLEDKELQELTLYDEPFVYYNASKESEGKTITIKDIRSNELCLMEEGHCMRTQVLELCNYKLSKKQSSLNFEYKAGSIDSLIRFVKSNQVATLLPYLSTLEFNPTEKLHVSHFESPIPYRTIGLVYHRHFVKKKILQSLQKTILENVINHLPTLNPNERRLSPH